MKRFLMNNNLYLLIILFVFISCGNSSSSSKVNDSQDKEETTTSERRRTGKQIINDEGWEELCTVNAYIKKYDDMFEKDVMKPEDFYHIYYKGDKYIAIDVDELKLYTSPTRFSVEKGHFRQCGETYNARISRYGNWRYCNF